MRDLTITIKETYGAPGFRLVIEETSVYETTQRHMDRSLGVEEILAVAQLLDQLGENGRPRGAAATTVQRLVKAVLREKQGEIQDALGEARETVRMMPQLETSLAKIKALKL